MEKIRVQTTYYITEDGTVEPSVQKDYPVDGRHIIACEDISDIPADGTLPDPNIGEVEMTMHSIKVRHIIKDPAYTVTNFEDFD